VVKSRDNETPHSVIILGLCFFHIKVKVEETVKFTLKQPTKAQRRSRNIALLFL
jgi:hypothetical protein